MTFGVERVSNAGEAASRATKGFDAGANSLLLGVFEQVARRGNPRDNGTMREFLNCGMPGCKCFASTPSRFVRHMNKKHGVNITVEQLADVAERQIRKRVRRGAKLLTALLQKHMDDHNLTADEREQNVRALEAASAHLG